MMPDIAIERLVSRAAYYIRSAKTHLERGERADAERYTRRAEAFLTVINRARLLAAVARLEKAIA